MNTEIIFSEIIPAVIIGYLLGSIPFALVIGKVFYKTDIRQHGSGNLGGGNAGRVLGKKAGLSVMTMDILKVALTIFLTSLFAKSETTLVIAGMAAALGHCFPLFARFKGGKAVATMYGFLFGMMLFASYSPWIFFLPLLGFLVILYIWKIIAVASIGSALLVTLFVYLTTDSTAMVIALLIFDVLMVWRHRSNIRRIIRHEENKISWM